MGSIQRVLSWLAILAGLAAGAGPAHAVDYFEAYGLKPASAPLDLGVQPLGYPSGVISAVMQRDLTLRAALAAAGYPLQPHAFKRGADMVGLLADHKLEAALLGDMPTLLAASNGGVWIVGIVKQTSTAIVAGSGAPVHALAGKRIGYVPLSSAHSTLLQGLASAQLKEADVKLVPMGIGDLPDALARGEIDAFAGWEPAPSVALANDQRNRIVFRGLTTDYFVIDRAFEQRAPEAARLLVAGFARAIEWMRRSPKNLEQAAAWVQADGTAFSGQASAATVAQVVAITRRDILGIPSAPLIVRNGAFLPLKSEYDFLAGLNKLPTGAQWDHIASAFGYDGLRQVWQDPRKYELHKFDYQK